MSLILPGSNVVGVTVDPATNRVTCMLSSGDVVDAGVVQDAVEGWIDELGRLLLRTSTGSIQNYGILRGVGVGGVVLTAVGPSTAQSIPGSTITAVTLAGGAGTEGTWSAANPTRMVAVASGFYLITGSIKWSSSLGGTRRMFLRDNAGNILAQTATPAALDLGDPGMSITAVARLSAGGYAELAVQQTTLLLPLTISQVTAGLTRLA